MGTLAEYVKNAIRQTRSGETIGMRKTPVVSYWPMREKWQHWGWVPWTYISTDGDARSGQGRTTIPAILRLVYLRTSSGDVCQLAYVIRKEVQYPQGDEDKNHVEDYNRARCNTPEAISI